MRETVGFEKACTGMEEYLFDLRGYLILENALTPEQLEACNATYDELKEFGSRLEEPVGWWGNVRVRKNCGQQELFISTGVSSAAPFGLATSSWNELRLNAVRF